MKKKTLLGYLVLLTALTSCGRVANSNNKDHKRPGPTFSSHKDKGVDENNTPPPASHLSAAFKAWFNQLGKLPQQGKVSTAKVWIKNDLQWLSQLCLQGENNVVVNAARESISPGGGIDGALHQSVSKMLSPTSITGWGKVSLPTGGDAKTLQAGEYALSDDTYKVTIKGKGFGFKLYHAVGPRASKTTKLKDAQDKVRKLYYDLLCKAQASGVKRIILPAISTELFAGPGPGFTKKEFIWAVYEGMYLAIQLFLQNHTETQLSIVLNNWTPPGV